MKNFCFLMILALILSGCGRKETFETVSDELVQSVMAQPRQIAVRLPEDALAPVLENEAEQVYLGEDYEIILQTLSSGDLNATVQTVSGYGKDRVTLMQTQQQEVNRYEFVWVCAGENGERLGRGVILDDGNYHYCLSVLRDAGMEEASQEVWNGLFSSFALIDTGAIE